MFDALTPDAKVLQGRAFAMLLAGGDFRCRAEKTVNLHCSRQK